MHKQVSVHIPQTVNFCPNSPESPFLEFQTRKPIPQWKTSDLRWPKFTPEYPPKWKLQIWDDQSLLWNTPPQMKNFRFEMTKVYSRIPPSMKTSDLRWPKFTPEYPPPPKWKLQIWDDQSLLQNTAPNEKLQIWDDQSLLQNTHQMKTSDLRWPKFTLEYPPNEKLQIWDDQSLLQNTPLHENFRFEMTKVYSRIPPSMKTSDLRWPKFTPEYPPKWKTSDLIWPKFTPEYPSNENFRFEMTKVYSRIPPPPQACNPGSAENTDKTFCVSTMSTLQNHPKILLKATSNRVRKL